MEIKEELGIQDQLHRNSMFASSLRTPSIGQSTMVGFDDVLYEIMDKLTRGQLHRQIIPIVGMGGIGKTTLAKNVYVNPLIVQHFHSRAWVTVSQEYSTREILLEVLFCVNNKESRENLSQMSEHELGEELHKNLSGKRYLIIMDDIWSIEVWNKVKFFFPDNHNESRIIITTRLSEVVFQLTVSHSLKMDLLDEDKSWNLLSKSVFGEEDCPSELREIGEKIAKNCKGLPLSIVVIGGLLATSEQTQEYWEYIAENLNSIVSLEDNERCLKILHTSYKQLPIHLKPCFLHMGIFPEDSKIRVSELIKLWVAEGFLKPIDGKSMEVVAEEYLKNLIDRNLILIHKLGSNGKIKFCKIHDILRDVCLREAHKQKFLIIVRQHSIKIPQGIDTKRRIVINQSTFEEKSLSQFLRGLHGSTSEKKYSSRVFHTLQSVSLARSLICEFEGVLPSLNLRLLRVLRAAHKDSYSRCQCSPEAVPQFVNARFLAIKVYDFRTYKFPSSVCPLWNLQTLIIHGTARSEIWKMPRLRHIECNRLYLPNPSSDNFVLENLQTLFKVINFKCDADMVKRIPNIKKLQILYREFDEGSQYCLNRLLKLESFGCFFHIYELRRSDLLQNLTFPHSLKKLTLEGSRLHWEDITTKIGSLPLLEVLKLKCLSFIGPQWETVEGQFCSLKFLLVEDCYDLEYWTTDSTHFPRLEHLVLRRLDKLKEIPLGIGEILTLQSIELEDCSSSAVDSAKRIQEEQEELGNVGLQVQVRSFGEAFRR